MAVKIYSDVTNKFYDNEAAALKAEEEVKKAQDEKTARRKKMAETVDTKRKAYDKARKEYREALDNFCKDYGSYHYTLADKDLEDFFASFGLW